MFKSTIPLHISIFVFSFAGVLSKLAARQPFLSLRFLLFYGLALCIMAGYALIWQQLLKRLPLSTAYACKGLSVVWAMLWGVLLFGEVLSWQLLLAAVLVVAGVGLVVSGDE